jgi:hypothetical protein
MNCATAIAVAQAESGLRCNAISKPNTNGTIDRGLFQLNSAYHPLLLDCLDNIKYAYGIYQAWGGFHAWSAYNNKSYVKYIR